jgi:hypothetical protein
MHKVIVAIIVLAAFLLAGAGELFAKAIELYTNK